jgi:type I restriction enzyme, S subunit
MWMTVKLGDVATVIAGQSPKGEHYNKEGRGTPFYQGKKDYGETYLNQPTVWTDVVTKLAEKDDILMSVRAPVGALNIATQKICIGRGLAAIRPSTEILHDYLFYSLLLISHQLEGSAGAIFNSINKAQIEAIEIPLPPIAEQQRIVAKLDAAFAEIDRAVEASEKSLANAKHLFEQQRNSRYELAKDSYPCHKISDVAELNRGHNPSKSEFIYEPKEGYVRFYQIRDAKTDKHATYVPDSEKLKRVKPHDFLMNAYRHIGEVFKGADGAFNVALCKLSIKDVNVINSDYLYYMIPSNLIKGELLKTSARSLIPSMSVKELAEFYVPIPPLQEQQKFIAELLTLKQHSSQITEIYAKKLGTLSALKSAILNQELQPPQSEAA